VGGACNTQGDTRYANKDLVCNHEEQRKLGLCRHSWDDDIRIYVRLTGFEDVDSV
jgi:hypothetical protein